MAEVARRDDVSRALTGDGGAGFREREVAPGLFAISIDPELALREYLQDQLPVRALADALSSSRVFQYFAAATPGMNELLSVGKAWELTQPSRRTPGGGRYDLVIVDAPATGHGLALLQAPRTFSDIARVGPVARQGRTIHRTITDSRHTGIVAVATPEEMPVTETIELSALLHGELGMRLDRVVVNAVEPARIGPRQAGRLRRALEEGPEPLAAAALRAALSEHERARHQREQIARLAAALEEEPATLPLVFAPEVGREELQRLSELLEAAL